MVIYSIWPDTVSGRISGYFQKPVSGRVSGKSNPVSGRIPDIKIAGLSGRISGAMHQKTVMEMKVPTQLFHHFYLPPVFQIWWAAQ
jgi:hypothetical protein